MAELIDSERVGVRVQNGTEFPVRHLLEKHEGALGYTVTESACSGVASRARSYKRLANAVKYWEELVQRPLNTRRLQSEVWCTGLHLVTGRETEEGTLQVGTLVRRVLAFKSTQRIRFEASTDEGKTWHDQVTPWTSETAKALGL